ncbi:hypothetical protein KKF05_03735 [Patescibacteria group bacterium]|nr:hypothetical protein [Patescibacteria group bacterium]MBU1029145.1 hypothetical protein [Patescibacteria group bacterium]MBU1916389.1 hypothetical protein [Patescibacteria group bacterium]
MKYSKLFGKTSKTVLHDADSVNARLLTQAGFVDQLMAGVYTYLPLGLRTLDKIKQIVREEMNAIGGQEILMPALLPKDLWETTGRWSDPGPEVMFQFKGRGEREYGLGWTHEEIVTPLAKRFVSSYRDLPFAVYQIQDKFRNEPRAKSGLLRGREFSMKDLYSFHANLEDLDRFYEQAAQAYQRIFQRCGLAALYVEASGGAFSKYSHEFQVLTESGEDIIFHCEKCGYAQNREISEFADGDTCPKCGGTMHEGKAIEVGNIFRLKDRFSTAFGLTYTGADGQEHDVLMGCYGIGPSRVLGSAVEVHHDERGICWPKEITPYSAQVIAVTGKDSGANAKVLETCEQLVQDLTITGLEPLYDDREGVRAGEKFADADLIGLPVRIVISEKTLAQNSGEWKLRTDEKLELVAVSDIVGNLQRFFRK